MSCSDKPIFVIIKETPAGYSFDNDVTYNSPFAKHVLSQPADMTHPSLVVTSSWGLNKSITQMATGNAGFSILQRANNKSNFIRTHNNRRKFVGFAAGSGITPIMSMIKQLKMDEVESSFTLFYSNKTDNDVIFKDTLEELAGDKLKVNYIYSRQKINNPLFEGRISKSKATELIKADLSCLNADAFYLCGPEEMIFNIKTALEEFGVLDTKIKFELFTTPVLMAEKQENQEVDKNFDGEALVTVIYDDEEVEFNLNKEGDSILDAAMDNDMDVPFSCKGAVCCTCKAKVTEGKVIMDANYALSDQEVEDGFVLACQSHPASAKVTIDFD